MSLVKNFLVYIFLVAAFASPACSSMEYTLLRGKCGPWLGPNFFGLPHEERIAQFEQLDIETQYILFLCASRIIHPRNYDIINAFAKGGEAKAQYLYNKLNETSSAGTIDSIVSILGYMHRNKLYNVQENAGLTILMSEKIDSMEHSLLKQSTIKTYMRIQFSSDTFTMSYQFEDKRCNEWVTTLFRLPNRKQLLQFNMLDIQTQYDIILCGNRACFYTDHLASYFMKNHADATEFLKSKLASAAQDELIHDIVEILTKGGSLYGKDKTVDTELVSLILARADSISDKELKIMTNMLVRNLTWKPKK